MLQRQSKVNNSQHVIFGKTYFKPSTTEGFLLPVIKRLIPVAANA